MDFDMTQVVTQSDTEGEDEENDKSAPIAHIKVLNQPSLKKKLYPIHKGDNTVGRQDLCQVSIPVRSLSKKHACIEVRGRSHFIYDMGSRNKTRRGTHYLTPEVRYELRNNDMLVFADVSCIYLVEDSARASDSGSETDPMSDSETAVFHTVAVDMYNTGPNANRVVNPELIEATVASDPNSCDSAASSEILMPTQEFAVVRIDHESAKQTDAVHSIKSPGNKINNKGPEVVTIFVADSDSENEENGDKEDTLRFQNNDKNEDSLDMDLLAAATQVYVPDSEEDDDDNHSEILDVIQDYKTTDDQTGVPDSQKDDLQKPLLHVNTKDPADSLIDKNGSPPPSPPFRTLFAINALRTYSKKGGSNRNTPNVSSQSIDLSKDEGEETQDPNLFDLPTLVADEDLLHRRPSSDNDTPLVSPIKNNKSRANSTTDETETLVVADDDKDTLPVENEITLTASVNNREASTLPVTVDLSDAISDTSSTKTTKSNDTTNSVLNAVSATLVACEEEQATVEVMTEETMPVAVIVDVRDSDTLEVDHFQEDSGKQSKEGNPSMEPTLQVTEELNTVSTSEVCIETCIKSTPSKKPSSELSDPGSTRKPFSENRSINKLNSKLQTPIKEKKESPGNTSRRLTVSLEMLDTPVSSRRVLKTTPSSKDKPSKIIQIDDDDDVLEATQPYTINCTDSPYVKSKRSLRLTLNNFDENEEEDTQPYTLANDEMSNRRKGRGRAHLRRSGEHDVSDEENSVEVCEKDDLVQLYQEVDTLPLEAESEDEKNQKMESRSQNAPSTSEISRNKKVPALKGTTKETATSSSGGEPSKMEKPSSQNEEKIGRVSEEHSILENDKMAETSAPRERLPSEESCSSLTEMPPEAKRSTTRRSLKDSQEKNTEIMVRKSSRSSKKNNAEEGDGTENVATSVGPSCEDGANGKKTAKRNVHFVGISPSEEDNSEESTRTRSSSRQKGKEETVVKKKVGRPSKKQTNGKNDENINKVDPEESSSKQSRGRKSTRNVDELNDEKNSQTSQLEENAAIANKRTSSVLDDSKETSRTNLTQTKRSRGCKSKSDNENKTLGSNKMAVSKEPPKKLPVLDKKVSKKDDTLEIPEKLSDLGTQRSPLEEAVPAKDEEEENEAKSDASKTTKDTKDKAEKNEAEVEKDSPPARTSRATRSKKSKDEDEKEKPIKKNVAEVDSCTRVSRSSRSKTVSISVVSEDPEKLPTVEPTPKVKQGKTEKKTDSQKSEIALKEEPSPSNAVPRNTRKASRERKVSEDTCTTARPSRSARTKKQKDEDVKEDVEEVTVKEKSLQRQTKNDSVESNKVTKTKGQQNKKSENSPENNETSLVDDDDKDAADDDNDFVAPSSVERNLEKRSTFERRISSSLSVSLEKLGSASSCLKIKENENAKAEPKIGRKRNQNSQSSDQNSLALNTPKRQHLNRSLSSSPGTPSSRSQSAASKPKVMFTGVTDDKLQKIVTDLGGRVVTSFDSCTHLVTDKIRRTVKFLCCLSRGIPIVSPSWLTNCKSAKSFTDHTSHIVKDPSTEKQYKFSLRNSLQQAKDGPLLENYKIHVTKSVQPNVDIMKEILNGCKAQYLRKMPNEDAENTVVISCEEDRTLCQPALDAGVPVVNAEFILTGILQYDISINFYQFLQKQKEASRNGQRKYGCC